MTDLLSRLNNPLIIFLCCIQFKLLVSSLRGVKRLIISNLQILFQSAQKQILFLLHQTGPVFLIIIIIIMFNVSKRKRCISVISWVAGFSGVCSCNWSIFRLFGWHFARSIVGFVHSFISNIVGSFIRCIHSFVLWPFIRSHGLCVHPLPSALGFPSCDCYQLNHELETRS